MGAGYTTFSEWNAEKVSEAIVSAVDNLNSLAATARAGAVKWSADNGGEELVRFMEGIGA